MLLLCSALLLCTTSAVQHPFGSEDDDMGLGQWGEHNLVVNIDISDPSTEVADRYIEDCMEVRSIYDELESSQYSPAASRAAPRVRLSPAKLAMLTAMGLINGAEAGSTACPPAQFHPLNLAFGLFHVVDSNCVGVVKKSGALMPDVLPPGLHFRPMRYFGESVTDLYQIPDTDEYDNIMAKTKDHIKYKFKISVTNQVLPEDMVEVVRKMGFAYDQTELKRIVDSSVREVVMSLGWKEIETDRANDLNELFMQKIQQDLIAKFGEVDGKRLRITMTTVIVAECQNQELTRELQQQAMHVSRAETEKKKREADQEVFRTEQAKIQSEVDQAELKRVNDAQRQMRTVQAEAERQQVANEQSIRNAEAKAQAAKIEAESKTAALAAEAQVYSKYPEYGNHLQKMAEADAIRGTDSKLVFSHPLMSAATGVLGGFQRAAGKAAGWFGSSGSQEL